MAVLQYCCGRQEATNALLNIECHVLPYCIVPSKSLRRLKAIGYDARAILSVPQKKEHA